MTRTPERRVAVAAVLLLVLLALVGAASRGGLGTAGGEGDGRRLVLSDAVVGYLYALVLLLAVLTVPLLLALRARDRGGPERGRLRQALLPLGLVAGAGALLYAALRWPDSVTEAVDRLRLWDRMGGGERSGARPPTPQPLPLLVASSTLLAAGLLVAGRRLRPRSAPPTAADALAAALSRSLDDVRAEADARRAILLAYAHMETALESAGAPRHEADAPLEYLGRVLLELDVPAAPVAELTDLFERAKFSQHPLDAAHKERAIAALEHVRADLAERA